MWARKHPRPLPNPCFERFFRPVGTIASVATSPTPEPEVPAFELTQAPRTIDTQEALASAVSTCDKPRSIGVAYVFAASRRGHPPEPRTTPLQSLALALHRDDNPTEVWVLNCAALDLGALDVLWRGHDAPYVVFFDAHEAGAALVKARDALSDRPELAMPQRFGCLRTTTALIAAGTERTRASKTLHGLAKRLLERELPGQTDHHGQLAGELGSSLAHTLACAAASLVPMMRKLTPLLRKRGLAKVYELECNLVPVVLDMELAGITVDGTLFQQFVADWVRERERLRHDPEAVGQPPKALRSRMARLDKLISNFGHFSRDFIGLDGRVRCHLDPLATDSGRFACYRPNLQQIPGEHTVPGLRKCFAAAPDHALIIADYAQIELRVAAHLAGCPVLRQVFVDGRDPHRATASQLARKPEAEISDYERKLAKAVNFGFLFGMGAKRFRSYARSSYGLDLDIVQAQQARDRFFATYPGLSTWHRRVGRLGGPRNLRPVTVRTALGRRKHFVAGAFSFTAALNIPVQGTAADGFKLAMIQLVPVLRELGGRGVLCVHDEYIAEVPCEVATLACQQVRETMEAAMAEVVTSVPIVVEAHVADTWG